MHAGRPTWWAVAVLAFAAAILPGPARAQVDIERMRQDSRGKGLYSRASLSLSTRSGNVDATNLELGGRVQYVHSRNTVFLAFSGDYGWQGGEQFSNQGLAHLRYVRSLTDRVAAEVFVQSDYDKSRLLDARALAGAGGRFEVARGERLGIALGTSCMFEHEKLSLPPAARHPDETDVGRWSNYAGVRWTINERSTLSTTAYAQPQIDDFGDVRVIAEGALETKVAGAVSLALTGRLRHDSRPPDGIESTDTKLGTALAVSF